MTLHAFDEATQGVIDNFDAHAKTRASDLLTPSTNKTIDSIRESCFCLGYKTGVTDLSGAWKTSELAVKALEQLFESACAWRDSPEVDARFLAGTSEGHEDRLIVLVDAMRAARKAGTP